MTKKEENENRMRYSRFYFRQCRNEINEREISVHNRILNKNPNKEEIEKLRQACNSEIQELQYQNLSIFKKIILKIKGK